MNSKLKIFHLYGNKQNLGDWGSAEGIKFLLKKYLNTSIYFEDHFFSFSNLKTKDIDNINNNFDMVIIGGGGIYWPSSKKILFKISEKQLKKINKPIITYGVGVNIENDEIKEKNSLNNKILKLDKILKLSSVRDFKSRKYFEKNNINTNLVPCPSMFLESNIDFDLLSEYKNKKIGFVLIPLCRIPEEYQKNYIKILFDFIVNKKKEYDCFLISHSKQLEDSYYKLSKDLDIQLIYTTNPNQLMSIYKQMDFVIGSRGHMSIFALGANTPFINLSYNLKCDAFAEMINYPKELSEKIENLNYEELIEKFDFLIKNEKKIKDILFFKKQEFLKLNKYYIDSIKKML